MSLQSIPVTLIEPHPKNPRRELGDLTELADSIRAHGVRQNLLLVPVTDAEGYRVVIGHRRLAAARMAGLTDVPAVVDPYLTEAGQIELMLLENVQRTDLTPIEEADGYQQLLDLGVKVTMIAKRTGRARKTIDSRLALLGLPLVAQEKVHARQLSLEDAAALAEFEDDEKATAELLKHAGTPNWKWAVERERQAREERLARQPIIDKLVALGFDAMPEGPSGDYRPSVTFRSVDEIGDADEYPADAVFLPSAWSSSVTLYVLRDDIVRADDPDAEAKRAARAEEEAERRRREEELAAEAAQALALRDDFVARVLDRKLTAPEKAAIVGTAATALLDGELGDLWQLGKWLKSDDPAERFRERFPEGVLLAMIHAGQRSTYGWATAHEYEGLVAEYVLLEQLGYEISDVERARVFPDEATS